MSANTAQSQILSHLGQLVLELGSEDAIVRLVVDNRYFCCLSFKLLLGTQGFSSSEVENRGHKNKATSMVHKDQGLGESLPLELKSLPGMDIMKWSVETFSPGMVASLERTYSIFVVGSLEAVAVGANLLQLLAFVKQARTAERLYIL